MLLKLGLPWRARSEAVDSVFCDVRNSKSWVRLGDACKVRRGAARKRQ